MTTTPTPTTTFAEVLAGARMLTPTERARLIALLAEELALRAQASNTAAQAAYDEAWARWDRLRADLAALGPTTPTLAEQLDQDRRERDAMLMGRTDDDAHA
jgi:hypothetical protein